MRTFVVAVAAATHYGCQLIRQGPAAAITPWWRRRPASPPHRRHRPSSTRFHCRPSVGRITGKWRGWLLPVTTTIPRYRYNHYPPLPVQSLPPPLPVQSLPVQLLVLFRPSFTGICIAAGSGRFRRHNGAVGLRPRRSPLSGRLGNPRRAARVGVEKPQKK